MAGVSLFLRSLTLLHGASNSHTRTDSNAFWTSILIWSRVLASLLPSRSKSAENTAAASLPTACQSRNTMWRWPNFGATAGGEEEDEDEEDVSCATFLAARACFLFCLFVCLLVLLLVLLLLLLLLLLLMVVVVVVVVVVIVAVD